MDYEEVLVAVDDLGLYQVLVFMLLALVNVWVLLESMAVNFLSPSDHKHWCHVPGLQDCSYDWREVLIPSTGEEGKYDECQMYEPLTAIFTCDDVINWTNMTSQNTTKCTSGWEFDDSVYRSTATSEVRQ